MTDDVRQELLTSMRGAADEIIGSAFERLLQLPGYGRLPAEDADDVREFSSWLFHVFVSCLEEDRGLSPAETARLAAVGQKRSGRGISVDAFRAAFEIVYDRSHAALADLAAEMADPTATSVLGEISRTLGSLSRTAVLVVASGFDDVPDPPMDPEMGPASRLLQALMTGVVDRALIADAARRLELTADDALDIVIALLGEPPSEELSVLLSLDGDRRGELLASTVRRRPVPHVVGLVTVQGDGQSLGGALAARETGHILITQRLRSVTDLGAQYTDIRPYLHLTHHLADGEAVPLDDLRMFAVLSAADLNNVESFVRGRLGDVLAQEPDTAEPLLATIGAYLESGRSNKLAGERLHLHPKSVAARINRIRQDTTVRLDAGVASMLTLMAVQVFRTHERDLPDIGDQWWAG